jgi:hypothetical protein
VNAPAAPSFVLITCERGIGRMQARACARRWKLGNTAPGKLAATERMSASGIRNSPCRNCPHGEARATAGEHEAETPLVRLQDIALITPQHRRAQAEIERRLEAEKAEQRLPRPPALPREAKREPEPAPERRCRICSSKLTGHARAATCGGDCQWEYNRRKALASYYAKRGRTEDAAAVMAGQLPSERREAAGRAEAQPAPTPVVAKGEPIAESPVLEQERQVDSGNVKSAI